MRNSIQLDLLPSMSPPKLPGNAAGGSSAGSLFHSMYASRNRSGLSETGGAADSGMSSQDRGIVSVNRLSGSGDSGELKRKIRELTGSLSETSVPESAIPELVYLMRSQGFSSDRILQMIGMSRNSEGLVQLDILFSQINRTLNSALNPETVPKYDQGGLTQIPKVRGLSDDILSLMINGSDKKDGAVTPESLMSKITAAVSAGGKDNAPVVERGSVPGIREMLFRMGLGAGDVRSVIEKSVNPRGEVNVAELASALKGFLYAGGAEKDILNFPAAENIKIRPEQYFDSLDNADFKILFGDLPVSSSHDMHKHVKQNIAALLRERGVPVEEVKSFLDSFSLDISKNAGKAEGKAGPEILLNRNDVKNETALRGGAWNERILGILRNERIIISGHFGRDSVTEKAGLRLDFNELVNQGGQRTEIEQIIQAAARSAGQRSGPDLKTPPEVGQSRAPNIMNAIAANSMNIKMEKEIQPAFSLNRSEEPVSLPQPLPKIIDRMFWMIGSGEQRSRMSVSPPELGRLDISLSIKNGHLQANLNTESLMVKEMIEANLNQLKQQLSSQGITVDRFDVMVGLGDDRPGEDNSWAGWSRKKTGSGRSGVSLSHEAVMEIPSEKTIISSTQVDVHV